MKKSIMSILLSLIICAIVLMVTTYIHVATVTELESSYYMTKNHKIFKKGPKQVSFFDVFDVDKDTNVLVFSEYDETDYVGIYDPKMVFARQNSFQLMGTTRYLNKTDYKNKTKAGILLSESENINQCQALGEMKMDVVLYCAVFEDMFQDNVTHLLNLSSLSHIGDRVYIDFDDSSAVEPIIKKMKDLGYQDVSKTNYGFIETFKEVDRSLMSFYIIVLGVVYSLFHMMLFWSFLNNRKNIYLHFLHGGDQFTIFIRYLKTFLLGNASGIIFIYALKTLLETIGYVRFSNISFLWLLFAHVLISSLLLFVSFSSVYKKVTTAYEELDYVH